jgi:hypothetical protein
VKPVDARDTPMDELDTAKPAGRSEFMLSDLACFSAGLAGWHGRPLVASVVSKQVDPLQHVSVPGR